MIAAPSPTTAIRPAPRPGSYCVLVSTTAGARDIRRNMGNADYSYAFVLKALAPLLDRLGPWQVVERPESSLSYRAARAREQGLTPIHLCLHPPHNAYLTPDVPTVAFPFWEFPSLPDRDMGLDTRQNWKRILDRADLILTACRFTAATFRREGLRPPIAVVPVPLPDSAFSVPDWDPRWTFELDCRHVVLGGPEEPGAGPGPGAADPPRLPAADDPDRPSWQRLAGRAYLRGRAFYKRNVMRYLSEEAAEALFQAKNRLMRRTVATRILRPPLARLTLGGLVFTSIFNLGDRRKNIDDLLSAVLLAFQDRPDVTLVLKLATNPDREYFELKELRTRYDRMNIRHRCRVVAITDYLSDADLASLSRATTYYLNTSKAEGACLPLQESLAAGRPAVAPRHSALEDYIDDQVAFVVRSDPEPTYIPHDPDPRFETSWHRLNWQQLHDHLLEAARVAERDPERYRRMADAGRRRMKSLASREAAASALIEALGQLPESAHHRTLSWSA
ncbi:glycosyltransferase [Tautonia sociabilis]|uniref:Glycosyltransferase family 1 protein n=1 Tax=Tautonia sociabilis TaxID=2080755 RepID=A0A432MDE8_9BACT|nr:glycosyltransferase [Tautonia sociabilis]RUL82085.1 glycosyltransferase family 1 protein [Tautonia sociabilis]